MNRIGWIGAAAVGLAVVAWGWTRPAPVVQVPAVPEAKVQPEVSHLQDEIRQLSARQSRLASEVAAKGEPPQEGTSAPEGDPGAEAALTLDAALSSGGRDPSWSSGAEDLVVQHVEGTPGLALQDVECGRAMCRIELEVQAMEAMGAVQSAVPWHAPSFIAIETAAIPPTAVMYVAREGTVLPIGG